MTPKELQDRTRRFALDIVALSEHLPQTIPGKHIGVQLVRSATSVAANYRAACRGRSRSEFAAKIGTVLEEADESDFWLGFAVDAMLLSRADTAALMKEADELVAIFAQSRITVTRRR